jgi:hypothetical protein
MLDSVLDESEIQAGCNISLQVSNIKTHSCLRHSTCRMNFALFEQILTLPLFFTKRHSSVGKVLSNAGRLVGGCSWYSIFVVCTLYRFPPFLISHLWQYRDCNGKL